MEWKIYITDDYSLRIKFKSNFFILTTFDNFEKVGIFGDTKNKPSIIHVDGVYSLRCKVCKTHKSSYKRKKCSQTYGKQIVLHVEDCWAPFHISPESYLKRKKKIQINLLNIYTHVHI